MLGPLLNSVFIYLHFCHVIEFCRYLIFADDIKRFVLNIRFKDCAVLQYDVQLSIHRLVSC